MECMEAAGKTLLDGKERIKQTPLSATIRAEMLAQDAQSQLDAAFQTAPCITLAVDESTVINDNA